MKTTTIALILSYLTFGSFAQDSTNWKLFPPVNKPNKNSTPTIQKKEVNPTVLSPENGSLVIVQDERIVHLMEKDKRINENEMTIPGYRVQLYSGSGTNVREEANKIKSDFLKKYEDAPSYVFYDQPTWKTRVGDFRTKLEAEQFLMQIQEDFPNSFVVPDDINFPKLDK